jgi:CBS domain-containing protein
MPGRQAIARRTVRSDETLRVAARRMARGGLTCLVALEADEPRGLVTERDVVLAALGGGLEPEAPVAALAWRPLVSVVRGERADEALRLMEAHGIRHLPVSGAAGRIVGMVGIEEALALLLHDLTELTRRSMEGSSSRLRARGLRAEDTEVALPALEGGAPARALAAQMSRDGTHAVLVLEGGRPVGLVTERDLLSIVAGRCDAERMRARHLVRRTLVTVAPSDPVEAVVDRMARHGVEHVAVVRAQRTLGVVSLQGLLGVLAFQLAELLAQGAAEVYRERDRAPALLH